VIEGPEMQKDMKSNDVELKCSTQQAQHGYLHPTDSGLRRSDTMCQSHGAMSHDQKNIGALANPI
jgi:hypothetical protein